MKIDRRPSDILVFLAIVVELLIVVASACWTAMTGILGWLFSRRKREEARRMRELLKSEVEDNWYA